jgi:hypothetical protein
MTLTRRRPARARVDGGRGGNAGLGIVADVENEVAPVCDGIVIHPGTPKEERISLPEARRRGIHVDDPNLQAAIDSARET